MMTIDERISDLANSTSTFYLKYGAPAAVAARKASAPAPVDHGACTRCGGNGYIRCFDHVEGGVCFKCRGRG